MGIRRFDLSLNIVSFMCDWAVKDSRFVLFLKLDVEINVILAIQMVLDMFFFSVRNEFSVFCFHGGFYF